MKKSILLLTSLCVFAFVFLAACFGGGGASFKDTAAAGNAALKELAQDNNGCVDNNPETHFCDTRDNKKYKIVKIGDQTWMARNLNYNAEGSYCYDNEPKKCNIYGRLYNWETAMAVCPEGWHLPSNAEWDSLLSFVDNSYGSISKGQTKMSKEASRYLKAKFAWAATGTTDAYGSMALGTDDYGFMALPGGGGGFNNAGNASFTGNGLAGLWWAASEHDAQNAYYCGITGTTGTSQYEGVALPKDARDVAICGMPILKIGLLSVRCIQD